ncbi:MAG: hypothetical protein JW818_08110 [Pirellulales bacterium]|nr:hypothetical protein [Pirellulales bacterium]
MRFHRRRILVLGLLGLVGFAVPARAADRVELVIHVEKGAPLMGRQNWVRDLGKAGFTQVRFRQSRAGAPTGVEVHGTEPSRRYVVTGVLDVRGDLVVAGRRYREGDGDRLARWLGDLAKNGLPKPAEPKAAFNLTQAQYATLRKDLAQPVGFATKDKARSDVVRRIGDRLQTPLQIEPDARKALSAEGDKVAEDLQGMSAGTALACVLRPAGLCLVPRLATNGTPVCTVRAAGPKEEIWPIGHVPRTPEIKLVPALFARHQIRIENVSAADVVKTIAEAAKLPVLYDHNALARHGIDPAKKLVSIAQRQASYDQTLIRALYQAGLKRELRVDESGRAFLWITTLEPV